MVLCVRGRTKLHFTEQEVEAERGMGTLWVPIIVSVSDSSQSNGRVSLRGACHAHLALHLDLISGLVVITDTIGALTVCPALP